MRILLVLPVLLPLLALLLADTAPAQQPATLVARPDGGWDTAGLPYTAHITAKGALTSLRVNGFDFLAANGLYVVDGGIPIPFTTARLIRDILVLENAKARLELRFLPDRIEIVGMNHSLADSTCLRLALNAGIARVKNPDTGEEYALPITDVSGQSRLIAPNDASLTLPGLRLTAADDACVTILPGCYPPGGAQKLITLRIAPAPLVEDRVKVAFKVDRDDHTSWNSEPLTLTTDFTGMADAGFDGIVVVRLKSYLTKAVARELRQPLKLVKGVTQSLRWTLEKLDPALYLVEVGVEQHREHGVCCTPRVVFRANDLTAPDPPTDFDEFWQRTLEEQAKIPLDLHLTKVRDQGALELYKFNFAGLLGYRCYGFLTLPKNKSKKYPAILRLPPAGMRGQAPPFFGDNCVGMMININTVDIDLSEYEWETWPPPYVARGLLDRDRYGLRFCYAAVVRAAEVLAARSEVQADNIQVVGSSQGGGLVLVAAGLYPKFKSAEASVPALCRLDWNQKYLQPPFFPIAVATGDDFAVARTLAYFDAVHFARRITCPIAVTLGLQDDVTPSMGVFCAYNAIPGKEKSLTVKAMSGH